MTNARRPNRKPADQPEPEFDWDALVAEPKRATARVALCFRADLNGRHRELQAQLAALTKDRDGIADDRRMGQVDPRTTIAAEIESIEKQMQAATQAVELVAMPRQEFRALGAQHPPRPSNARDELYQVNESTIFPALLAECATTPKRDAAWWTTLLDEVLNDGQYERLTVEVWNVNRADVAAPFSKLASVVTRNSGGK